MDDTGAFTERLCYECWAIKDVNPSPEGFLQAQKHTSKWRYMHHEILSFYDKNAREFKMGTRADALGKLQEQRAVSPVGCQAKKLWNCNCDEDALRMTCDALDDEDMTALENSEGMAALSFSKIWRRPSRSSRNV